MSRIIKLAIVVSLLLSAACSSTTFIYNRLDFIVPWYLDDYVDLEKVQRKQLDGLLQPFLHWHRMEELPRYLELLDGLIADLDEPATVEKLNEVSGEFEQAWLRLEARGLDWLLQMGADLSDSQIEEFIASMRKDQVKYEKKYLQRSEQEYREELYDDLLDNTQDFLGRLDWGQRSILQLASDGLRRSDDIWLAERELWLQWMENVLARDPGWQQEIRDVVARRELTSTAEYREVSEVNLAIIQQAMVDVLNSRSEKQDRRLRKKLNNFRDDLLTLIAQGEATKS